MLLEQSGELAAGELAALIGVEDCGGVTWLVLSNQFDLEIRGPGC